MQKIKDMLKKLKGNKQLLMTICGVFLLLLLCGGVTFAIFNYSDGSGDNDINSGHISMTYTEPSNEYIVENALPMKDGEAMGLANYFEFSVTTTAKTNESDDNGVSLPYEITITESEGNTLASNQIKMYLTEVEGEREIDHIAPTLVSNFEPSLYKDIGTKIGFKLHLHRNGNETVTTKYRLRAWIDFDVDATNWYKEDKYVYKFRVNVNGEATYQGYETDLSCFNYEKNVQGTYTIWGYNFDKCDSKNIVVPASIPEVAMVPYKAIKSITWPSGDQMISSYKELYFTSECSGYADFETCLEDNGMTVAEFETLVLEEYDILQSEYRGLAGGNYYKHVGMLEDLEEIKNAWGLDIVVELGEEQEIEEVVPVKVAYVKTLADVDYGVSPAADSDTNNVVNGLNNVIDGNKNKLNKIADEPIYVNSVILPSSVDLISGYLFDGLEVGYLYDENGNFPKKCFEDGLTRFVCDGIKNIRIPNGLGTVIYNGLFRNDIGDDLPIDSVVIPSDVREIDTYAFLESGLKTVIFSEGLVKIGKDAFKDNSLTKIVIPSTVTEIGAGAFENNKITNLILEEGITTIASAAFRTNLITDLNLPDSVTTIGHSAFYSNKLEKIKFSKNLNIIDISVFKNNNIKELNIPDNITSIGGDAFAHNKLRTINISNSVTTIGSSAFSGNKLTTLEIPSNVVSVGEGAFSNNKLKYVKAQNSTDFLSTPFSGNKIEKIENDDGETPIGCYEYTTDNGSISIIKFNCGGVINLTIQNTIEGATVTAVGGFKDIKLKRVILPSTITAISISAFSGSGLTNINLPNSLTNIGSSAFYRNMLTKVKIPETVTSIGNEAFSYNRIEEINIPESITTIQTRLLENNKLKSIKLPSKVYKIMPYAFADNQLTSIVIPDSIYSIGDYAFTNNKLEEVTIGSCYEIGSSAFSNNLINKLTLDKNTTKIGATAFLNNQLTSVYISELVTEIGSFAFSENKIESVEIASKHIKSIPMGLFSDNRLKNITIPEWVKSIGSSAFSGNDLTTVVIPSSVTTISTNAFKKTETSNPDLIKIVNKPSVEFDWGKILGGSTNKFVTGTVTTDYGDVNIVAE